MRTITNNQIIFEKAMGRKIYTNKKNTFAIVGRFFSSKKWLLTDWYLAKIVED